MSREREEFTEALRRVIQCASITCSTKILSKISYNRLERYLQYVWPDSGYSGRYLDKYCYK